MMDGKARLREYSKTAHTCKEFVSPQVILLVDECHDILDIISQDTVEDVGKMTAIVEMNLSILRNAFAFDSVLAPGAWENNGLVEVLQRIIHLYFEDTNMVTFSVDTTKLRKVVAQVIANASTSSVDWCRVLYHALFPVGYLRLALTEFRDVGSALALSLYNICKSDTKEDDIVQSVVGSDGCLVLSMLLQTEVHYGENDSLALLLAYLCFEKGCLGILFTSLVDEDANRENTKSGKDHPVHWLNSNHAYLVEKLASDVSLSFLESHKEDILANACKETLVFIHTLILDIVSYSSKEIEYNECTIEVLRNCLHLWRDALSRHQDGLSHCAQVFLEHQMVRGYISMLRAIQEEQGSSLYIKKQPYKGYKSDILSVLANASFRTQAIQQCIIEQDALYPILACVRGDPDAPLAREWALWTIRNLCECSPEARASIESLEKKSPSDDRGDPSAGEYHVIRGPEGLTIKMK